MGALPARVLIILLVHHMVATIHFGTTRCTQLPAPGEHPVSYYNGAMLPPRLILASSSPQRRELLFEAGYVFEVVAPHEDVECGLCSGEGPAGFVAEMAYRKATAVRDQLQRRSGNQAASEPIVLEVIVAADTVAECDGLILGKPRDEEDARRMLAHLRGRSHRVLTGVCVWPADRQQPLIEVAATRLRMDRLPDAEIDDYLASGDWEGKAGAFGYQDRLGWIHVEQGSESNVVGLPLELLGEMLERLGFAP